MTFNTAPKWHRDWLAWLLAATVLYGFVCLVSLATDVGRPFPGFFTYHNLILGRLEMVRNAPAWWWGLSDAEPAITDTLLQIEQTPFHELATPLNERVVYQQAWDAGQNDIAIIVQRQNEQLTLRVPLTPFSWRHYLDFMFAPIIISATLWLLAWLLYRSAPEDDTQRLAAVLLLLMAVEAIGIHPSLFHYDQPLDRILSIGNLATAVGGLMLGVVFCQFAGRFPYAITDAWFRLVKGLLLGLALLGLLAFIAARIIIYTTGIVPAAQLLDKLYFYLWIGLMLIGVAAVFVRMLYEAVSRKNQRRQRQEARILLLAILVMLPATLLVGHYLVDAQGSLSQLKFFADSRYFPLALPFAFAAISLRYHTFSGAQHWFSLALLLAGSGLLANVGTAISFWNHFDLLRETAVPPTIIFFFLFMAVGLVWGWQTSWRGWLGRVFDWQRVSYHVVQQIGEELLEQHEFEETAVSQTIATTLADALQVAFTAVWVLAGESYLLHGTAGEWHSPPPAKLPLPSKQPGQPLRGEAAAGLWPALPPVTAVIPLGTVSAPLGLIAVGPRWDTAVFDDRDLEIFALIGQQVTRFLQNSHQTARLQQNEQNILATLTHAHQKTAQDLHDHLLPALSRIQLNLLTISNLAEEQPGLARQAARNSQADLAATAELIRRIQQGLVIRPLEFGLRAYLVEIVQRFRQENDVAVVQTLPKDLDALLPSAPLREALYAVWQQALDNVQRHAQATEVVINLTLEPAGGKFSIGDNGRGCSADQLDFALQNGRFGIRSMQIRLESVGGQLQFQSEPGRGSCIYGEFPLGNAN